MSWKPAGPGGEESLGKRWSLAAGWRGEAERNAHEEGRSAAKQQALKEKRCEIETTESRTDSHSCGSRGDCNTRPSPVFPF